MNQPPEQSRPATLCVHAGTLPDDRTGGVCSPIFSSTAYANPNPTGQNVYPRYFNVPNQRGLAAKLAALEHGEDAIVFGSGMAAISTLLFAVLKPGDHALFQADLYGGTWHFVTGELRRFGIEVSFARHTGDFAGQLRGNTRMIYVESPSNPLLRCVDLAAVATLARSRGILTAIDNTFATPINQLPLTLGIDAVIHSATKYLNGHSDVNAGAIIASKATVARAAEIAVNHGATLDSHACFQLERGLKTLQLRVQRQNENALTLARFLQQQPSVGKVLYPGLPDHPDHALAARQMRGFGGMLAFELRDERQVQSVLDGFKLVTPALSLGGVETLVSVPRLTSHKLLTPEERRTAGINDSLLRVSVGIEDIADLESDFAEALRHA